MGAAVTAPAPETGTRKDVFELVNDKLIEKLRQGKVPWHEPWGEYGPPTNLITSKTPYKGINALLLGMEGYERNWFMTFDQVNGVGGKVTRGSKGQVICRWDKQKDAETPENTDSKKPNYLLKSYTVFNIGQCEKIPDNLVPAQHKPMHISGYELIAKCMPKCPKIVHTPQDYYYDPVEDTIYLPKPKGYKTSALYHARLFHLLVHSTGHDSRLARQGVAEMSEQTGNLLFSKEELVAEIGTCFLLSHCGIPMPFPNNEEHAQGWLAKLQDDKRLIFTACKEAQKAVDYILDIQRTEESASTD